MSNFDVAVFGAGLGGVAAALAAADAGRSVVLIEPGEWVGGQLTVQGVCTPDEVGIESVLVVETSGATSTYRELRHRIREYYHQHSTLSAQGQKLPVLNMGGCWVNGGFATEATVGHRILMAMLAQRHTLRVWLGTTIATGQFRDGQVESITVKRPDGSHDEVTATIFIDATETGDLLPLLGLPFRIGAEPQATTGEPDAPAEAHPEWIQAITTPFTLIRRPEGENHTIPKPANYEAIKAAQNFGFLDGQVNSAFGGNEAIWKYAVRPNGEVVGDFNGDSAFWKYRRVIASAFFSDPKYAHDVANINVGSNDYKAQIYPTGDPATDAATIAGARAVSEAYCYWLQTEAPRDHDKTRVGYPNLMPAKGFFGGQEWISPQPYVRESRRINALYTIVEQNISQANNPGVRAENFPDSVGLGNYAMDVHGIPNGPGGMYTATSPFQIPVRALVPQDATNLIAGCKNIGTTHITNGAYRLHPQEWNIGEAAGVLAALSCTSQSTPQTIVTSEPGVLTLQKQLLQRGVPIFWWIDVDSSMHCFEAVHLLGVRGIISGDPGSLAFRPADIMTAEEKQDIAASAGVGITWPAGVITRANAVILVAQTLGLI